MTSALILATSENLIASSFDPTKNIGGMSPLKRQISTFRQAGIDRIAVAVGREADKIESHCSRLRVVFVRGGLREGLEYLKFKCTEAFVVPSSYPFFSCNTVKSMLGYQTAAVLPEFRGNAGYPLLLSGKLFDVISAYGGDRGLIDLLQPDGVQAFPVPVEDKGILMNAEIADKTELEAMAADHSLHRLKPDVKISLSREHSFFGPGTLHLLYLTEEAESLMQASKLMGMSYSKARKLVARMESCLGYQILESHHGGRTGGYSTLTPQARVLMRKYKAIQDEAQEKVEEIFRKHFGDDVSSYE